MILLPTVCPIKFSLSEQKMLAVEALACVYPSCLDRKTVEWGNSCPISFVLGGFLNHTSSCVNQQSCQIIVKNTFLSKGLLSIPKARQQQPCDSISISMRSIVSKLQDVALSCILLQWSDPLHSCNMECRGPAEEPITFCIKEPHNISTSN